MNTSETRKEERNPMQLIRIVGLLLVASILVVASVVIYDIAPKVQMMAPAPIITNFEECALAGNAVMESYPRQCRTKDGRLFVEDVSVGGILPIANYPPMNETSMQANGCAVAGCSGQLCVSAEEAGTIMTTCEYRAEYACYREAVCESQADGTCGWTQTPTLLSCLQSPPPFDQDLEVL